MKKNVVLIGMPGAGKSTVGVVLAKNLGYSFIDSDLLIQEYAGKLLHNIIEEKGLDGFEEIENKVNASISTFSSVIATGGSVIYGKEAMAHLKEIGTVVYLSLPYEEIEHRLGDLNEGQKLKSLYDERVPMYEDYADVIVECEGLQIREIVHQIKARVSFFN